MIRQNIKSPNNRIERFFGFAAYIGEVEAPTFARGEEMSMCKLLIGNCIYPIGFPIMMITRDKLKESVRTSEVFILMSPPQSPVQYIR